MLYPDELQARIAKLRNLTFCDCKLIAYSF